MKSVAVIYGDNTNFQGCLATGTWIYLTTGSLGKVLQAFKSNRLSAGVPVNAKEASWVDEAGSIDDTDDLRLGDGVIGRQRQDCGKVEVRVRAKLYDLGRQPTRHEQACRSMGSVLRAMLGPLESCGLCCLGHMLDPARFCRPKQRANPPVHLETNAKQSDTSPFVL